MQESMEELLARATLLGLQQIYASKQRVTKDMVKILTPENKLELRKFVLRKLLPFVVSDGGDEKQLSELIEQEKKETACMMLSRLTRKQQHSRLFLFLSAVERLSDDDNETECLFLSWEYIDEDLLNYYKVLVQKQ